MKDEVDQFEPRDALEQIKEAEAKAISIIQEAREKKSVEIIQEAQEEARKIIQDHLTRTREKARKKREISIQLAENKAKKIRKTSGDEASDLHHKAEAQIPAAVKKTAEKIKGYLKGLDY